VGELHNRPKAWFERSRLGSRSDRTGFDFSLDRLGRSDLRVLNLILTLLVFFLVIV